MKVAARAPGYGRATREGVEAGAHVELFLFPGATLRGTVVDGDGEPVEGAVVQAAGGGLWSTPPPSERTDATGRFVMAGVEEGEYVVVAREGGRAPGVAEAAVQGDDGAFVEIVVTEGGFVTGRLVDTQGDPLAGRVAVEAVEGLGLPSFLQGPLVVEARDGGRMVLGPVPLGTLDIVARAPGHAPSRLTAQVPAPGTTVDLGDVVLDRGLAIRGQVVHEDGVPVGEATVRAQPQWGGLRAAPETSSDALGAFEVAGLEEGEYALTASAPGYAEARASARGGDEDVELRLGAAGEIGGRVVDAEGRPVPEAMIGAEPADGPTSPRFDRSVYTLPEGDDGAFVLRDIAAGQWVLHASASGKGEASLPGVEVADGNTTDVGTVVLARGGMVRGTVVDANGSGIPGATVQAERDVHSRTGFLRTRSGSDGAFQIRGVPAGRLAVFAHHPTFAPSDRLIVEVDPQAEGEPVRLVLERGGRIEGLALHRDGRPFSEGRVMAWLLGPDRPGVGSDGVPVGPEGWYALDHLPLGRTRIHLMAYTSSNPQVVGTAQTLTGVAGSEAEVRDGETVTVDFSLRDVIVAGQVTRGGEPAPGLRVTLTGQDSAAFGFVGPAQPSVASPTGPPPLTAVTGPDGRYELLVFTPGRYHTLLRDEVEVQSFPGREVDVPDVELFELNLEIADATVSGVLVDAETGAPVTEGHVGLIEGGAEGSWAGSGRVGPDGRFTVAVEPGEYRLDARARGWKTVFQDLSVGPSGLDGLRVEMERGLEITGRVVDAAGRPVGGTFVAAHDGERSESSTHTLPDGTFRLGGLEERPYALATGGELLGFAIRRGVRPDRDPVTLRLEPGGRIAVRVLDAAGQPVKDAYPWVRGVGGVRLRIPGLRLGPTDQAGSVEIAAPRGEVEVEVRTPTHGGTGMVTVRAGQTTALTVVVEAKPSTSTP